VLDVADADARRVLSRSGRRAAWAADRSDQQPIPVGRTGTPDDNAHTASFLVSEGAAGFVSGQVIYVAGGPRA